MSLPLRSFAGISVCGLLLGAAQAQGAPHAGVTPAVPAVGVMPTGLRCEYRANPLGVDTPHPRLDWLLQSRHPAARGLRQTAYRVLAASSPALLGKDRGDLWDSGKVVSDKTSQIAYDGRPLPSGQPCWWKVRVMDQAGHPSAWSAPARWTMGILSEAAWHGARWIGAEAAVTTAGVAGLIGYHAAETMSQDDVKWVQVDLGKAAPLASVRLYPMQHAGKDGFGFPRRFKIEGADDAGFSHPITITDQTAADYPNPGLKTVSFPANQVRARYVRVTATKLWLRDAAITGVAAYAFALHRLEVDSGGLDAAAGTVVTAKDSVESSEWGQAALTAFAPASPKAASTDSLLLRRRFTVRPRLTRALAFVCGLGQYEMTLNGSKVGDAVLTPGWTKYDKTCLYDTYDITSALHPGANAVGLFLGNGFYNIHPGRYTKITGSFGPQRAIGLIRLEYADGKIDTVVTDRRWKIGAGPITFSSIYGGEDYDARRLPAGWDRAGFDDSAWESPTVTPGPGGALKGLSGAAPPIRRFAALTPVGRTPLSPNVTVYDLGQNASLMLRLTVSGPAGSSVKVTPSERVHENGDINDTMCGGDSFWTYTLSGQGEETYDSRFYYRGGRYLKVELQPAPGGGRLPAVTRLAGDVIRADAPTVGRFSCSSALFNKVYRLVRWAQMNNMVSVLTDCPTREKLGWLEEDHLNGPSLRYNFDLSTLMSKMVGDMADSQRPDGLVPSTCPDFPQWGEGAFTNPPEWGSACIAVPWQQYEFDGDLSLLRRDYDTMKRYVDYLSVRANDHIVNFGLGDWYDNQHEGPSTLTPIGLTATAFYDFDCRTLARIARLVGRPEDAARDNDLAAQIRAAYNQKFFHADTNNYATGSQASNAFSLAMDMVAPDRRAAVLENLVSDMQAKGTTAGEVSLRYVLEALADGGHSDLIATTYGTDKSGYGLQVKQGQTSLTEGWNGDASQDHFMFGQINEWFFRDLAGIQDDPAGPGFRKIIIRPALVGDLTEAGASYDSLQGEIVSRWTRHGRALALNVTIPPNTTATVYVPARDAASVREGGRPASRSAGITGWGMQGAAAVFGVLSGTYSFTSLWK